MHSARKKIHFRCFAVPRHCFVTTEEDYEGHLKKFLEKKHDDSLETSVVTLDEALEKDHAAHVIATLKSCKEGMLPGEALTHLEKALFVA